MKNRLIISAIVLMFNSSYGQSSTTELKTTNIPPASRVLFPYATGVRLAWVYNGNVYVNNVIVPSSVMSTIPSYSLIDNQTSAGLYTERILNPSSVGGLSTTFPGLGQFTGLAGCGMCTPDPSVIDAVCLSLTYSVSGVLNHYIVVAKKYTGSNDFTVTNAYIINAPFAPATSWTIGHITYIAGQMYALFNKNTGTGTLLASIDPLTGSSAAIYNWPSSCYTGLNYLTSIHNFVLLDVAANQILNFDATTGVTTTTPFSCTTIPSCGNYLSYNYFTAINTYYCYYAGDVICNTGGAPPTTICYHLLNGSSIIGSFSFNTGLIGDSDH